MRLNPAMEEEVKIRRRDSARVDGAEKGGNVGRNACCMVIHGGPRRVI